jgi:hypothetical protein
MPDPIVSGAIPGANVVGIQASPISPVSGLRSVTGAIGSQTNPLLPGYPSGQAVPSTGAVSPTSGVTPAPFSANAGPYGSTGLPNIGSALPGTNVSGGLQQAGYPGSVADALSQFLQGGAGYNPQVAQALLASLQPGIERGSQQIVEQYGASGLGNSSAAAIGLGDYLSQANLNEGQILSGLYENSVQNYMNVLTGAKKQGPGTLGDISALLAGLGGGQGIAGIAGLIGKLFGAGSSTAGTATSAASGILPSLPTVGEAGSLAAAGVGGAGSALGALPTVGEAGSLAAAGLGAGAGIGGAAAGLGGALGGGLASLPISGLGSAGLAGALTPDAISALGGTAGAAGAAGGAAGGGGLLSSIGALATNPFTIGIAALLGGGLLAKDLFFKGANPNQVPAAQTEQPYEAAGDDIYRMAKAGMITPQQATQYLQQLQTQGQSAEQALVPKIGDVATKGSQNLTNVINNLVSSLGKLPATQAQPLNLQSMQSQFIQPNQAGWYPGTGTQAMQLLSQLGIQ